MLGVPGSGRAERGKGSSCFTASQCSTNGCNRDVGGILRVEWSRSPSDASLTLRGKCSIKVLCVEPGSECKVEVTLRAGIKEQGVSMKRLCYRACSCWGGGTEHPVCLPTPHFFPFWAPSTQILSPGACRLPTQLPWPRLRPGYPPVSTSLGLPSAQQDLPVGSRAGCPECRQGRQVQAG